jgi:branched-chain amino acid transport system substrate-binding protein
MDSKTLLIGIVVVIIVVGIAAFFATSGHKGKMSTSTPQTSASPPPAQSSTASAAQPQTTSTMSPSKASQKEIKLMIGVLVDESGPTSDVGKDYAKGVVAALKYFNKKGVYTEDGVRVRIEYVKRDYAYNPSKAIEFYKEFRDRYGVVAIIGWGTADTEKLADQVAQDKILYISASYSAKLVTKPYNFFPAPDYSTQACAALNWVKEQGGKTLALLYDHKVAYSKSPIPAIKAYAGHLGLTVVADVDLPLKATAVDADRAATQLLSKKPDYAWCGNTIHSCALAAAAMAKHGLSTVMVADVWGFDERFPEMAGEEVAGKVAGVSPWKWPEYAKDKPGYKELYEAAQEAGLKPEEVNLHFMQGFINVWLLVKAIERTASADLVQKKGEALKEALESSCSGDPIKLGDITPPMRFCPGKHLAFTSVYIVMYGEDGKFHFMGPASPQGFDCVAATQG